MHSEKPNINGELKATLDSLENILEETFKTQQNIHHKFLAELIKRGDSTSVLQMEIPSWPPMDADIIKEDPTPPNNHNELRKKGILRKIYTELDVPLPDELIIDPSTIEKEEKKNRYTDNPGPS